MVLRSAIEAQENKKFGGWRKKKAKDAGVGETLERFKRLSERREKKAKNAIYRNKKEYSVEKGRKKKEKGWTCEWEYREL